MLGKQEQKIKQHLGKKHSMGKQLLGKMRNLHGAQGHVLPRRVEKKMERKEMIKDL